MFFLLASVSLCVHVCVSGMITNGTNVPSSIDNCLHTCMASDTWDDRKSLFKVSSVGEDRRLSNV